MIKILRTKGMEIELTTPPPTGVVVMGSNGMVMMSVETADMLKKGEKK